MERYLTERHDLNLKTKINMKCVFLGMRLPACFVIHVCFLQKDEKGNKRMGIEVLFQHKLGETKSTVHSEGSWWYTRLYFFMDASAHTEPNQNSTRDTIASWLLLVRSFQHISSIKSSGPSISKLQVDTWEESQRQSKCHCSTSCLLLDLEQLRWGDSLSDPSVNSCTKLHAVVIK